MMLIIQCSIRGNYSQVTDVYSTNVISKENIHCITYCMYNGTKLGGADGASAPPLFLPSPGIFALNQYIYIFLQQNPRKSPLWRLCFFLLTGNYGKVTPDILRKFIYARGARLNNLLLSNCHVANRDGNFTNFLFYIFIAFCVISLKKFISVLVAVARTCLYLVDLDLSNCHVLNTGDYTFFFLFFTLIHSQMKNTIRANISILRNWSWKW